MASQHVLTISSANFDQEVAKATGPVLVDFWAEWCGPCKMISPLIDEIAEEKAGKLKVRSTTRRGPRCVPGCNGSPR